MTNRAALAALVILLAGCSSPGEGPPEGPAPSIESSGSDSSTTAAAPPLNSTPEPEPDLPATLLTWSNCAMGAATLVHRPEAASGLVPPGYVQTTVAGQAGYNSLLAFRCTGAQALGAYAADTGLAIYGVNVMAPPGLEAPERSNVYLLHLVHDAAFAGALAPRIPAAMPGEATVDGAAWTVEGGGAPLASVETVGDTSPQPDSTQLWRLHWVAGELACYADFEMVLAEEARNEAVLTAEGGSFQTVASPAPRMAGVSHRAHADGAMAMPVCVGAAG